MNILRCFLYICFVHIIFKVLIMYVSANISYKTMMPSLIWAAGSWLTEEAKNTYISLGNLL